MSRSPSGNLDSRRWKRVRRAVLERDGYRCRDCGKAGRLEVHHEVPVWKGPALAYVRGNLRTLCRTCHIGRHAKKRTPTERAWDSFLADFHGS